MDENLAQGPRKNNGVCLNSATFNDGALTCSSHITAQNRTGDIFRYSFNVFDRSHIQSLILRVCVISIGNRTTSSTIRD